MTSALVTDEPVVFCCEDYQRDGVITESDRLVLPVAGLWLVTAALDVTGATAQSMQPRCTLTNPDTSIDVNTGGVTLLTWTSTYEVAADVLPTYPDPFNLPGTGIKAAWPGGRIVVDATLMFEGGTPGESLLCWPATDGLQNMACMVAAVFDANGFASATIHAETYAQEDAVIEIYVKAASGVAGPPVTLMNEPDFAHRYSQFSVSRTDQPQIHFDVVTTDDAAGTVLRWAGGQPGGWQTQLPLTSQVVMAGAGMVQVWATNNESCEFSVGFDSFLQAYYVAPPTTVAYCTTGGGG